MTCLPPVETMVWFALVVEIVLALELGGNRLAQWLDAGDGRVFRLAAADGGDRRFLDVVGRVEIRLADGQRDHVLACGFEVARLLREDDGGGRLHALQRFGKKGHDGKAPDQRGLGSAQRTGSFVSAAGLRRNSALLMGAMKFTVPHTSQPGLCARRLAIATIIAIRPRPANCTGRR